MNGGFSYKQKGAHPLIDEELPIRTTWQQVKLKICVILVLKIKKPALKYILIEHFYL
jgi:hypothetical protein